MPRHFGACINIVGILRYEIDVLENETVKIVDLGSLCVTDVEQLSTIELPNGTLLDNKYPVIEILSLKERMNVVHEYCQLRLTIAIRQDNGNVE